MSCCSHLLRLNGINNYHIISTNSIINHINYGLVWFLITPYTGFSNSLLRIYLLIQVAATHTTDMQIRPALFICMSVSCTFVIPIPPILCQSLPFSKLDNVQDILSNPCPHPPRSGQNLERKEGKKERM